VASFRDPDGLLTRFVVGRRVSAEEVRDPVRIERLASALRAFHDSGETLPSTFDCFRVVEDHAAQARARGAVVPPDYEEAHAGMGHRFFDLGNLAVNNGFAPEDEERLLAAYFGAPAAAAQRAALSLMRFMSDFREAMWGVVQCAVSTVDFDYPAYAAEHFARLRETAANPDVRAWLSAASA
jgi:hypothetical protein